jgi:4-nitrophenyl phosphatase
MVNMDRPGAYILDLDGVIYHENAIIPGAAESVRQLRAAGSKVIFLTNNASRSRKSIAGKLEGMGISCNAGDVISSAFAAAVYINKKYGPSRIYPISEQGLVTELEKEDHTIADKDVDFVVVGLDRKFTYKKLSTGLDNLRKGACFIATNTDAVLPVENGFLPGAGSMVAALKTASGIEPFVIGKPNRPIMDILLEKYSLQGNECVIVGDRIETDILAGKRAGMETILVLTGVSGIEDIESSGIRPDRIMDSIADITYFL